MAQTDTQSVKFAPSGQQVIKTQLSHWMGWLYRDTSGQVSRPKLLATVFSIDGLIILATTILTITVFGQTLNLTFFAQSIVSGSITFATLLILQANWIYSISALRKTPGQVAKITISLITMSCIMAAGLYLMSISGLSRLWLPAWLGLTAATLTASRFIVAKAIDTLALRGHLVRRVVIVGGGEDANELIKQLDQSDDNHIEILGLFDDRGDERSPTDHASYKKLGTFDDLEAFCREEKVDLLIVTIPPSAENRLLQILDKLWVLSVDVKLSALNSKLRLHKSAYTYLGTLPMLPVFDKPLNDWERFIKNIEDKLLGTLILALSLPVMALVAIAIKWDSKGPVFFKQNRFGLNNELIKVYKFRSMYTDKSDANAATLVTKDDDRVTKVGRFIRRTSLDELPQLFNVLKGELSLVGPRPHATQAKAADRLYEQVVQGYFARHKMKAGITGWAQVSGWRGETDTEEKIQKRVECDLHYIDNWSVLYDLYIIALTPIALAFGKNAY